ncbi:MAG: CRISPR-associated protein Csm7 [Deltaproteobacteria bacterium]|nr:CRISPR-associated protein Csm7 [Deltaproteobacteria bacterium]
MLTLRVTLRARSAFATPLRGDTLFGHLCWAVVERFGEARLVELLDGYGAGRPFAVLGDPSPKDYLPRPFCPTPVWLAGTLLDPAQRKAEKARKWVGLTAVATPIRQWRKHAVALPWIAAATDQHNSINRQTGTTGKGLGFAPYQVDVQWYRGADGSGDLDLYAVIDSERLAIADFEVLLLDIGGGGYGKDASTGRGRFTVDAVTQHRWPKVARADAWLTLGPTAPQSAGQAWRADRSWYQPVLRFGRHGNRAALTGQPFKNPVVLADAGAVLTPAEMRETSFCGAGLGGGGRLSRAIPETVHQGYAPVVPIEVGQL